MKAFNFFNVIVCTLVIGGAASFFTKESMNRNLASDLLLENIEAEAGLWDELMQKIGWPNYYEWQNQEEKYITEKNKSFKGTQLVVSKQWDDFQIAHPNAILISTYEQGDIVVLDCKYTNETTYHWFEHKRADSETKFTDQQRPTKKHKMKCEEGCSIIYENEPSCWRDAKS